MRCTQCGEDFHPGRRSLETTADQQIDNPGIDGARTKTNLLILCPRCAASRRKTERIFFWLFFGGIALAVVAGLLAKLFPSG
jgi:hypothetical protein